MQTNRSKNPKTTEIVKLPRLLAVAPTRTDEDPVFD